MKKLIICMAMIISVSVADAQTGLYKTYDDFVNGKVEKMEDVQVSGFMAKLYYKFTSPDGTNVKYTPKEFWGFLFKGVLFRSVGGSTAMLQDSGKVCYYLNGEAGTDMVHYGRNRGMTFYGALCYLSSQGVNAKLYPMPFSLYDQKLYKNFKKDFPDLEDLHDCLKDYVYKQDYLRIRECVKEYNKSKSK